MATLRRHRLVTSHGPIDVMETIGDGLTYEALVDDSHWSDLNGISVRILGLKSIILFKGTSES